MVREGERGLRHQALRASCPHMIQAPPRQTQDSSPVNVALEIAMYQWQEGQQRLREADPADQGRLDTAMYAVLDGLRHRLGSTFEIAELADCTTAGTDWAEEIAQRRWAGGRRGRRGGRRVRALRPRGLGLRRRPSLWRERLGGPARPSCRGLSRRAGSRSGRARRDRHRPVAGPVLGVHRVVLDGGVEPQAVALLAVVEGPVERLAPAAPTRPPGVPAGGGAGLGLRRRRLRPAIAIVIVGSVGVARVALVLLLGLLVLLGLQRRGYRGLVLGPQIGLVLVDSRARKGRTRRTRSPRRAPARAPA